MSKRAEPNQMFQMLMTLIVIGMILILGFQLITNLFSTSEQIDFINFRRSIVNEIDAVARDYNARQRIDTSVPRGSLALCFIDVRETGTLPEHPIVTSYWQMSDYITQSDEDLIRNAFLIGTDFIVPFRVDSLEIDRSDRYVCIDARRSRVEFWAEGQGRRVTVEPVIE